VPPNTGKINKSFVTLYIQIIKEKMQFHWKFFKAPIFKQNMKLNWNFLGGGGVQNKKPSMGEYRYFLELLITVLLLIGLKRTMFT